MFNQKIKVEMSSIGQPITEYLVNFDLLKEMMKLLFQEEIPFSKLEIM